MPEKKRVAVYDLASRKSKTVGVIVPKLDSHFITTALKGIQEITTESGYDIIITHSQENMEKEAANVRLLSDRSVDGVLASLSVETKGTAHFSPLTDKGTPVVFFDRVEDACSSGTVVIDNARCGYLATEHLIRQGCRRIAIITSDLKRDVYKQRYKGFREALDSYGIAFSQELLLLPEGDSDTGTDAAQKVLHMKPLPDGLFITNDLTAAICMHTLNEAGIRVPEDIAIVGFNNDPVGRLITPALTTIDYPGFEIGKTAASTLLAHLSGRKTVTERTTAIVPSSLIIRNSSLRSQAS
ncbi:substrate-binding domain-containing protein [Flavitalea sp. BT771]|uniref:LacI family DNA-binding transcriptional regulator n=1 Tax=Flavitalea sp. BT771 TaxID=3063329 RepID=UPI0026E471B3|nr:substrate-binding domain-containing protein [Flavitalea sp. BT771]MDO6430316.1 substrate-binding domain-containing protein [Flavitalea sp. BT771]MDV6219544.1 substrate-binding domain-containing protein [Flavitalea sp. BT771]